MANGFYDEYENRLLSAAPEEVKEEDEIPEPEVDLTEEADEYYALPTTPRSRSLIWSVVSFVLSVLSLALCPFYYVSLVFAVASIVASLISRKNLGFFERYAIIGLILGIMGIVFGISSAIAIKLGIF